MFTLFGGLGISVAYGVLGFALSHYMGGSDDGRTFFTAYTTSFKTILSLGLILGIAAIVYKYQRAIAETIRGAFNEAELSDTEYYRYEHRFFSTFRSVTFSAEFVIIAWIIFSYAHFPLSGTGETMMMIAVCTEWALGVYVGRKLRYASEMLQSLLNVPVTRNLFRKRELDVINTYVHVASTLMLIFGYIHVVNYYEGPFRYDSIFGQSVKPFLLIPVIIGTPILLIFNFYPRTVLRKLYSRSIDFEARRLRKRLANASLTWYEKRSYIIEFKRMSREELRYSLQLTLSDLPIGITILIAAIQSLMRL